MFNLYILIIIVKYIALCICQLNYILLFFNQNKFYAGKTLKQVQGDICFFNYILVRAIKPKLSCRIYCCSLHIENYGLYFIKNFFIKNMKLKIIFNLFNNSYFLRFYFNTTLDYIKWTQNLEEYFMSNCKLEGRKVSYDYNLPFSYFINFDSCRKKYPGGDSNA